MKSLRMRNRFITMNPVTRPTAWYRRLMALAELNGDKTQQDVALRLGVAKATITNWKNGMRPDPKRIRDVARAYDADEYELLRLAYLDDEPKPKPKKGNRFSPPGQDPNKPPL